MKSRIALLIGMVLAAALVLTSCGVPDVAPETGEPVVLRVGATLEPTGLDPATVTGAGTPFVLLYNVFETLVKVDEENKLRPLLAEDWTVSTDGLTYTFHLDPAARFASGAKVDAAAVATSFERIRSGQGITDQARSAMAPVSRVEATEQNTLVVTLSQISHQWLYDMAGPSGIVYDPAGLDTLDTAPAGSGPYVFDSWDPGASITLKVNRKYWGTGPRVDGVDFMYYTDPNAMNSAMLTGQLDVISNLTVPDAIGQFEKDDRFKVLDGLTHGEVVLGFNHTNPALSDLLVRQAINYAIDRRALVDAVWGGKGAMIGTMVPPFDPWFDPTLVDYYTYDPAKAKELLAESGHATGLTLRLRVPTLPYGPSSARFVASQLAAVGIDVQVDELEFGAWLQQVYTNHDYDMTIVAHVEPRDLGTFANPNYYWLYNNPEFQKMMKQADAAPTEQENVALLKQASRLLTEDAAADWLFLLPNLVITTAEVTGIPANAPSLSFDLTQVATSR